MKTLTITLLEGELLYDIDNRTYLVGKSKQSDDTAKISADLQTDESFAVRNNLKRSLDLAFAEAKQYLYAYTKAIIIDVYANDDKLTNAKQYVFVLSCGDDFADVSADILTRYLHEYMVCRAIYDYYSLVSPDNAQLWAAKAADVGESITQSLNFRLKPLRRKMRPF